MNKLYNCLEYFLDLLFFLLLYFCKPFAKIIVDVFYPILSYVIKDHKLLSILIFFVPLIIFMFINKVIFKILQKRNDKDSR